MGPWGKIKPAFWDRRDSRLELLNYRRLWRTTFVSAVVVTLMPLVLLTAVNFYQFEQQYQLQRNEIASQTQRLLVKARVQVADFLDSRKAALTFVNMDNSAEQLADQDRLAVIFSRLRQSFGGVVDLGVIDAQGVQQAYVGPYALRGRHYTDQEWYQVVLIRGVYISDVFLGHRNFPHFVIAVRHEQDGENPSVLRATIDTGRLNVLLKAIDPQSAGEVFLVNQEGVLQTPSLRFGGVLSRFPLRPTAARLAGALEEFKDPTGKASLVGMAEIDGTPFAVVVVSQPKALLAKWDLLRINVIVMVLVSVMAILAVVWWGSTNLVSRIYEADLRRAQMLHEVEYTNKLASIGRLAAGVAHEINNPVAIINEKVGLMKDLLAVSDDFVHKDKFLKQAAVIQDSVKRVSDITHRLLGFARHLPVKFEQIHLEALLREVLGFLGREAQYRNVTIDMDIHDDLPAIEADKGQLQQVFLNIINNAMAAVADGGRIAIVAGLDDARHVAVTVGDNGVGIPPEDLKRIFEPFFSTKGERGTGLGLSITYGIVRKLGGRIDVSSAPGAGTTFKVVLPLKQDGDRAGSGQAGGPGHGPAANLSTKGDNKS